MSISVPEDMKKQFEKVFAGKNKSAVLAQLMQQAIEDQKRIGQRKRAIDQLLALREKASRVTDKAIRLARIQGRSWPHGLLTPVWWYNGLCRGKTARPTKRKPWLSCMRFSRELSSVLTPHWLAEVAAVLARLTPIQSISLVQAILAMELPLTMEWEVYEQACRLAVSLDHHLFDTLYHTVALQSSDAVLITADTQYFRKAVKLWHIIELKEFPRAGLV